VFLSGFFAEKISRDKGWENNFGARYEKKEK
jgi:hypothetical protein